jgi:hypothetical protein
MILLTTARESEISVRRLFKFDVIRIKDAVCWAISLPDPTEIPTSAFRRAGLSLIPSPRKATTVRLGSLLLRMRDVLDLGWGSD